MDAILRVDDGFSSCDLLVNFVLVCFCVFFGFGCSTSVHCANLGSAMDVCFLFCVHSCCGFRDCVRLTGVIELATAFECYASYLYTFIPTGIYFGTMVLQFRVGCCCLAQPSSWSCCYCTLGGALEQVWTILEWFFWSRSQVRLQSFVLFGG